MLSLAAEALWTARYDYAPGWRLVPHSHDYFQILHILAGSGEFHVGDHRLALTAGLTLLLKPGVVHDLTAHSEVKTLDVKFNVRSPELRQRLLAAPDRLQISGDDLPPLFDRLRGEGELRSRLYREFCDLHLCHILLLYLREAERPAAEPRDKKAVVPAADRLVRRAVAIIRERYDSGLSVNEIACVLGCSERTLRQRFTEVLGTRPLAYLQRFRVDRAQELIQYSDFTLKEIAGRTGFSTVQHFTRLFSQLTGESPAAWRARFRDGIRKDVVIKPQFSNTKWTVPGSPEPARSSRRRRGAA